MRFRKKPVVIEAVRVADILDASAPDDLRVFVASRALATFEAGDVVKLKTGGLPMTIETVLGFLPGKGAGVCCAWFDEEGLHRDAFDPSELEHTAARLPTPPEGSPAVGG